jgi:hypothetical protein
MRLTIQTLNSHFVHKLIKVEILCRLFLVTLAEQMYSELLVSYMNFFVFNG